MKQILIFIFILISLSSFAQETSISKYIYLCRETGSFGFSYDLNKALQMCKLDGGTKCDSISINSGFGAIARGYSAEGERITTVTSGFESQELANQRVVLMNENVNGINIQIVFTWFKK